MVGVAFLLLAWKNSWGSKGPMDAEKSIPILGGIEKDLGFPLEVMGRKTVDSSVAQQMEVQLWRSRKDLLDHKVRLELQGSEVQSTLISRHLKWMRLLGPLIRISDLALAANGKREAQWTA